MIRFIALLSTLVLSVNAIGAVWFVDKANVTGGEDGLAWASAFSTLQAAITAADASMAAGVYVKAIKQYRRALTARPRHAESRFKLAEAYRNAGRYYEARRNFRLAMSARPKNRVWESRCRIQTATCWEASGHYREALHEYRLALASSPKLAAAKAGHKRALAQVGK